jgi:site-specific recombinase XerD
MNFVNPIKDTQKITAMKEILRAAPVYGLRDEAMFVVGINTALRVSDIVQLAIGDVRDNKGNFQDCITLKEKKTGKNKTFPLNESIRKALRAYLDGRGAVRPENPLFAGKNGKSLSRVRVWQILNAAAAKIGLKHIGTHTLRKTFGYHCFQRSGGNIALVQKLLNHSSSADTLRYIGIEQEQLNAAYLDLNL